MERRSIIRDGLSVGFATGVYGVSFGVLAVAAGANLAQAVALSAIVFTGASQFAFVGVIATGGGSVAAAFPALVLAVRNGIYGLAMAPVLGGSRWQAALLAHLVIDESTAMARAQDDRELQRLGFVVTGLAVLVFWNLGTVLGALLGDGLADPAALGLDAMFPAAFIALLVPQLRRPGAPTAALAGGLIAAALLSVTAAGVPVLAASLGLVPAAVVLRRRA